jgi:hypothetical protein
MTNLTINKVDLHHIKEALESFQAELEILENDNVWYQSDSSDRLKSALQIVYELLGVVTYDGEDDYESEQRTLELRFD